MTYQMTDCIQTEEELRDILGYPSDLETLLAQMEVGGRRPLVATVVEVEAAVLMPHATRTRTRPCPACGRGTRRVSLSCA